MATNSQSLTGQVNFVPPVGDGAPRESTSAATRGRCPGEDSYATSVTRSSHYGLTASNRPSIFLHIPQSSVQEVFFSLKDENNNHLYQTRFSIPSTSGIVRFDMPDTAPELDPAVEYKWSFVLLCNDRLRPDSPRLEGWMQYKNDPVLLEQMANLAPLDQARILGEHGIWFDTLAALAEVRRTESIEPTTWAEFLESTGLTEIAAEPLVGNAIPLGN